MVYETATLRAKTPQELQNIGSSLAKSLYASQTTILLTGNLGAGKTTFVKGLASGLGLLPDSVVSPTFALEQRYPISQGTFVHIDLYRLKPLEAKTLLRTTDDLPGVRCVEWADRLPKEELPEDCIEIHIVEDGDGRSIQITCRDVPLPLEEQILHWRQVVHLPKHVCDHCDAVAKFSETLATLCLERCTFVRTQLLSRSAKLHDLLRFFDFREGASPLSISPSEETQTVWATWKARYPGASHEEAITEFLREEGFLAASSIVSTHGVRKVPLSPAHTIEQKILYYADKRLINDKLVTLRERFDDFAKRYNQGNLSPEQQIWLDQALNMEQDLGFSAV